MAAHGFELAFDYSDCRTQVIKYPDMGLYLKVLPEQLKRHRYAQEEIALTATFYSRGLQGQKLKEHASETHFLVLKGDYEKRALWDAQLLRDAVDYYCNEHLGICYDELHLIVQSKRMPFGMDFPE